MQAGQQPLLSLLSRAGAAQTILLGQSFNFAFASQQPWAKLRAQIRRCFGPRPSPASASEPALAQAAWWQVPVQPPKAAGGVCVGARAGLHPSSPVPDAAAWVHMHPQASLPPSPLLLQRGCRGDPRRGGHDDRTEPPPPHTPRHTHTFQRLYPSESQWLENSSYSSIFIFFGYNFSFGHIIN